MTKIKELELKIRELQKEIEKLKKQKEIEKLKKLNESNIWVLKEGNRYFAVEKLKVLAEMRKFAEPKDREWDGFNEHWTIGYDTENGEIFAELYLTYKFNRIYFETKQQAQACVNAVGKERIKRYYLEVK